VHPFVKVHYRNYPALNQRTLEHPKQSADGISWRSYSDPNSLLLDSNDVVWGGSKYVTVGYEGRIVSSCNGIDWVNEESATDLDLIATCWTIAKAAHGPSFSLPNAEFPTSMSWMTRHKVSPV
jgi:hypothetical protein